MNENDIVSLDQESGAWIDTGIEFENTPGLEQILAGDESLTPQEYRAKSEAETEVQVQQIKRAQQGQKLLRMFIANKDEQSKKLLENDEELGYLITPEMQKPENRWAKGRAVAERMDYVNSDEPVTLLKRELAGMTGEEKAKWKEKIEQTCSYGTKTELYEVYHDIWNERINKRYDEAKKAREQVGDTLNKSVRNYVYGGRMDIATKMMMVASGVDMDALKKARRAVQTIKDSNWGGKDLKTLRNRDVAEQVAKIIGNNQEAMNLFLAYVRELGAKNSVHDDHVQVARNKLMGVNNGDAPKTSGGVVGGTLKAVRRNVDKARDFITDTATTGIEFLSLDNSEFVRNEGRRHQTNTFLAKMIGAYEQGEEDALEEVGVVDAVGSKVGQMLGDTAFILSPYTTPIAVGSFIQGRAEEGRRLGLSEQEATNRALLFGVTDLVEEKIAFGKIGKITKTASFLNWAANKSDKVRKLVGWSMKSRLGQYGLNVGTGMLEESLAEPTAGYLMRTLAGEMFLDDEKGKEKWADTVAGIEKMTGGQDGVALLLYSMGMSALGMPAMNKKAEEFLTNSATVKALGGTEDSYVQAVLESKANNTNVGEEILKKTQEAWAEDPQGAKERVEEVVGQLENGEKIRALIEQSYWEVLSQQGVVPTIREAEEEGMYEVEMVAVDGTPRETVIMSEEQMLSYVSTVIDQNTEDHILRAQLAYVTEKMAEAGKEHGLFDEIELMTKEVEGKDGETITVIAPETYQAIKNRADIAMASMRAMRENGVSQEDIHNYVDKAFSRYVPQALFAKQGQDIEDRIRVEEARTGKKVDKSKIRTAANVVSFNYRDKQGQSTYKRVLRYARGHATVSNMLEESMEQAWLLWAYNEQINKDDMGLMLRDLQRKINELYPEASGKDHQFVGMDGDITERDITEALSKIARSEWLADAANNNKLSEWLRKFLNWVITHLGFHKAEVELGNMVKNVLENNPQQFELVNQAMAQMLEAGDNVMQGMQRDMLQDLMQQGKTQAELDAQYGQGVIRTPETVEAMAADKEALPDDEPEENEEENTPEAQEARDQVERAKVEALGEADDWGIFNNGVSLHDKEGVRTGYIDVTKLELCPDVVQFKKGADSKGVVHELTGGWRREMAGAIVVWKRLDGKLQIVSGRHRFAACTDSDIKCQVFDEAAGFDLEWAKLHDVEVNIMDNQATELEVARFIRAKGVSKSEAIANGWAREGKQSMLGCEIAVYGCDELINALANGKELSKSPKDCWKIAMAFPNNKDAQMAMIKRMEEGDSFSTAWQSGFTAQNKQQLKDWGVSTFGLKFDVNLFNEEVDDGFWDECDDIVKEKIRALDKWLRFANSADKVAGNKEFSKLFGIQVGDIEGVKKKLEELKAEKNKWKVWQSDPDLAKQVIADVAVKRGMISRAEADRRLGILATAPVEEEPGQGVEKGKIDFSLEDGEVGLKSHAPGGSNTNFSAEWEYELASIKKSAESAGVFMKAPNGENSHLSERLWCVVRTKAFKGWFGDWENDPENASKVVDENGEPMVVYHGSRHAGFRVFDNQDGDRQSDAPDGVSFFSSNSNVAYSYSGEWAEPDLSDEEKQELIDKYGIEEMDGGIYAVFLNIRDPYIIDFKGRNWQPDEAFYTLQDENGDYVYPLDGEEFYNTEEEAIERAEALGLKNYEVYPEYKTTNSVVEDAMDMGWCDGVIIKNVIDSGSYTDGDVGDDYIIFNSNQAKSANQNRGTFDAKSDRIDYSLEGDEQVLEPIEIEFEEQEGVNWRVAASEYIRDVLAGRVFDMPDGYRVAIPKGRNSRDRMVKGVRTQKRYEVIKGVERLFSVARLLKEEEGQHKLIEGKKRRELVDKANSYNVFGYPLLINGELHYGWFGAFNFDKDAPKDVVFYEFGVKEEDGFTGLAVGHDENHEVRPQLNPSSSEVTLGDLKRIVNGNNEGSEFSLEDAKGLGLIENGVGVFANGVLVEPGTDFNIDALHASPHLFPKFDTAFMGSGEGAQMYGWGLYFATRHGVNKWYFKNFSEKGKWVWCGEAITEDELVEKLVDGVDDIREKYATKEYDLRFSTMADAYIFLEALEDNDLFNLRLRANNALDSLSEDDEADMPYIASAKIKLAMISRFSDNVWIESQPATNYKVTLKAEDDEVLNWDDNVHKWMKANGLYQEWHNVCRNYNDNGYYISGKEVYKMLSLVLGSPKAASEWLLEKGVKGIKYADSGSRGRGGEKYYNYVMFSGDDVVIEKIDRSGEWNLDFDNWDNPSDVFGETNLSLLGEHAKTFWGYDESRMFKGRDDGRLRVEIDSSVAGLKKRWRNNIDKRRGEYVDELFEKNVWVVYKAMDVFKGIVAKYGEEFLVKYGEVKERFADAMLSGDMGKMEAAKAELDSLGGKVELLEADYKDFFGIHESMTGMGLWHNLCKKATEGEDAWEWIISTPYSSWIQESAIKAKNEGKFDRRELPGGISIGKVFDFPELYRAYPELKDIEFFVRNLGGSRGCYHPDAKSIVLDEERWRTCSDEEIKSTILHELGHAVQEIEEWVRGAGDRWMRYKLASQKQGILAEIRRVRGEVWWFSGRENAIDLLKSIRRLQRNPRSILKMGLRFEVREVMDVKVMAEQGIDKLVRDYGNLVIEDGDNAYGILNKNPGKGAVEEYYLPHFSRQHYERDREGYVEKMLEHVQETMSSRNNKKWQRELKKNLKAELERLYKEKEWVESKLSLSDGELYMQSAGEQESRAIQSRMNMSVEERMKKPFNESLDRSAEDTIMYTSFYGGFKPSMSYKSGEVGLKSHGPEGSNFSVDEGLREEIALTAAKKNKSKKVIRLCSMPRVLSALGERYADVETRVSVIKKLHFTHNLSEAEIYSVVENLDKPLYVLKDSAESYVFVLDLEGENNKGEQSPIMSALEIRKEDGHYMLSAYPLDSVQKIEVLIKQGKLVYSRDKKEEIEKAVRSYQRSILSMKETLNLLAVAHGFKDRVLTEADIVKEENRERENRTNFCIIGEGSEIFREYEEAGLVYVDKADGKKKAILDSRGVKLKHGLGGVPKTGAKVTSLGAVLDYPELYRAYPELKKLRVDLFRGEPHLGGYAVKDENYIAVNVEAGAWTSPLVTILHEVQHIIQGAEGFARGASGSMDKKSAIEYIEKSLEQLRERKDDWAKEQVEKLEVMKADIENPDGTIQPFFVYMVSHGEREADMVGTIMGTNSVGVSMTGADATEYMRLQEYSIPVIGDITPLGGVTFSAGRFGAMGHERLSAMGDKLYDEQVLKMRRAVERSAQRLAQFKEKGEENNGRELLLEATEMITAVQDMLPHSYGFSLEPYKVWLAIFSKIYGYDGRDFAWEEINKALNMLPQTSPKGFGTWHDIMNFSIMKNFKKWLKVAHEDVFFETHEEIKAMMAEKDTTPGEEEVPVKEDLAPEVEEAEIWMRVFEEYASEFLPIYGEVKVMAMMGKFMDRVAKQLDRYRKDVLLGRIRRVVDGVKVRKGKDGKPVKGKMTAEYYETLDKLMSLIELSEGQYEAVVEKYKEEEKEWEELDADMMLSVEVYNRDGDKEEIAISKREFDIYACYEEMSAEQADRCARALGEYIATGKQAWQNAEAKRKAELEAKMKPVLEEAGGMTDAEMSQVRRTMRGFKFEDCLGIFDMQANLSQFLSVLGKVRGFGHIASDLERRVARMNTAMQVSQKGGLEYLHNIVGRVIGSEDKYDIAEWISNNRTAKATGIKIRWQEPDWEAKAEKEYRVKILNLIKRKIKTYGKADVAMSISMGFLSLKGELEEEVKAIVGKAVPRENKKERGTEHKGFGENKVREVFTEAELSRYHDKEKWVKNRAKKLREQSGWSEPERELKRLSTRDELHISPLEAAYILMLAEQEDYAEMLSIKGYGEEVQEQLREYAGGDVMRVVYALRDKLNERSEQIKAKMEHKYGVPFGLVKNYFRAYFDVKQEVEEVEIGGHSAYGNMGGSGKHAITYARKKNHRANLDLTIDAVTAYMCAMAEQDLFLYTSDISNDMRGIINYKGDMMDGASGGRALEKILGKGTLERFEEWAKSLDKLGSEVERGYRGMNKIYNRIMQVGAKVLLAGRVGTLMKQTTAIVNSLYEADDIGLLDWAASMKRVLKGQGAISIKEMREHPVIASRDLSKLSATRHAIGIEAGDHVSNTERLNDLGMGEMSKSDVYWNAVSGAVLYDAVYRQAKASQPELGESGWSAAAMEAVEMALSRKGQPQTKWQKSFFAQRGGFMRIAWLFLGGESINTFADVATLARRGKYKQAAGKWLMHGTLLSLINALLNFATDDEKQRKRRQWWHLFVDSCMGPLMGIPVVSGLVGDGMSHVLSLVGYKYYSGVNNLTVPVANWDSLWRSGKKVWKSVTADDMKWYDRLIGSIDAMRGAAMVTAVAGGGNAKTSAVITGSALSAAAVLNGLEFVLESYRSIIENGGSWKKWIGEK